MKKILLLPLLLFSILAASQGVGISNDNSQPDASAMLDIKSSDKGLLIPRLTTLQRTSIGSPAIGLTVFDSDTYSFWVYRGDVMGGWREMLIDLDKRWTLSGSNIYNNNSGNVGIGTNNPQEKLSINAVNPSIQLLNSGSAKGYINVTTNDLRVGTYNNNTTGKLVFTTRAIDRMRIDENGLVGIGTNTGTSAFTLNGTNPSFQLRNADVDKGFLQLAGDNLTIGTNASNTSSNIIFSTLETEKMRLTDDGYLGLGSASPNAKLHINSTSVTDPAIRVQINGTTRFTAASNGGVAIGGLFTPPANGLRVIGESYFSDSVGIGTLTPTSTLTLNATGSNSIFPSIEIQNNGNPIGYLRGEQNARRDIAVSNALTDGRVILKASSNPFGVVVHPDYQVSITNSTKATGYELSVDGKIMCENMTMQNSGSWPDYVFEKDYKLRPLSEVKKFIKENKHLPNIPSASVIEKEGIKMQEITKALMEKIEELTLYILEQQQQIDDLKKQIEQKKE